MSVILIQPGDCVVQDPAASKVYAFDWSTDNLALGAIIPVVTGSSAFKITGLNPQGLTLNLVVTSLVYVDPILTITTAAPHGYSAADFITLAGLPVAPDSNGMNGTWPIVTVPTPTTFTFGFGGYAAPSSSIGVTVSRGLDQTSILTGAPYNSRWTQLRFTPNGVRGGLFEIANRIITNETPGQAKELSFQILVQDR